ncbi:MAG: hypothetical protein OEV06_02265 [Anaerolineae bacterium]|nr:hypothetical protein [Anaerolineae bacterium]
MKVHDFNKKDETKTGPLSGMVTRLNAMLGGDGQETDANEYIIARLGRLLDNTFSLMLDYPLGDTQVEIPMILAGPPGVYVFYTKTPPGIYEVNEDAWYEMHARRQVFQPAKINLVERTLLLAKGVKHFLEECGIPLEQVHAGMLFIDPGTHVDANNARVRVIRREALDKFATELITAKRTLGSQDIFSIAAMITRPEQAKRQMAQVRGETFEEILTDEELFPAAVDSDQPDWMKAIAEAEAEEQRAEIAAKAKAEADKVSLVEEFNEFVDKWAPSKMGFSQTQWLIVGGLLVGIFFMISAIFLVLFFL